MVTLLEHLYSDRFLVAFEILLRVLQIVFQKFNFALFVEQLQIKISYLGEQLINKFCLLAHDFLFL